MIKKRSYFPIWEILFPDTLESAPMIIELLYPPYPKDRGMLWFYVEAARRPQWC